MCVPKREQKVYRYLYRFADGYVVGFNKFLGGAIRHVLHVDRGVMLPVSILHDIYRVYRYDSVVPTLCNI